MLLAALEEGSEVGLLAVERHDRAGRCRRAYDKLARLAAAEFTQQTCQTKQQPQTEMPRSLELDVVRDLFHVLVLWIQVLGGSDELNGLVGQARLAHDP